jgi:hypothetical protein
MRGSGCRWHSGHLDRGSTGRILADFARILTVASGLEGVGWLQRPRCRGAMRTSGAGRRGSGRSSRMASAACGSALPLRHLLFPRRRRQCRLGGGGDGPAASAGLSVPSDYLIRSPIQETKRARRCGLRRRRQGIRGRTSGQRARADPLRGRCPWRHRRPKRMRGERCRKRRRRKRMRGRTSGKPPRTVLRLFAPEDDS